MGLYEDFIVFKFQRNCIIYFMNVVKKIFYVDFIFENSIDQGKLFRVVKKFLFKKEKLCFFNYFDKIIFVNDIVDFFVSKIDIICFNIDVLSLLCVKDIVFEDFVIGF